MTSGFTEFQSKADQSVVSAYATFQIVIPVYNDWESVSLLLPLVDEQLIAIVFTFCFLVLITRGQNPFIPAREYRFFVWKCTDVWPISAADAGDVAG